MSGIIVEKMPGKSIHIFSCWSTDFDLRVSKLSVLNKIGELLFSAENISPTLACITSLFPINKRPSSCPH